MVILSHDFDKHARAVLLVIIVPNNDLALELILEFLLDQLILFTIHDAESPIMQVEATDAVTAHKDTKDVEPLQIHHRL